MAEQDDGRAGRAEGLRELLRTSLEANDLEASVEAAAELYELTGDARAREVAEGLVGLLRERHLRERTSGEA